MTDGSASPIEETVSRDEFLNLQEQLKAAKAERDRQAFEKAEIVSRANGFARERDALRDQLDAITAERDRLIAEQASNGARVSGAEQRAAEAGSRLADAEAEVGRLRQALAQTPSSDPGQLLCALLSERTRSAVDWTRAQIPAESPLLPYFDKTVATATTIGCQALRLSKEAYVWAKPHALALIARGKQELQSRLEKK
jgi:hypothetical protein